VDVSTDGGTTWIPATLQEPVLPKCLTRFRLPWTWNGGPALLQSRAVDETGYVQPAKEMLVDVRGVNSGYHFNARQTWSIAQGGAITNVV
jgi:sulfane dehydrogenase subunit SoxC